MNSSSMHLDPQGKQLHLRPTLETRCDENGDPPIFGMRPGLRTAAVWATRVFELDRAGDAGRYRSHARGSCLPSKRRIIWNGPSGK